MVHDITTNTSGQKTLGWADPHTSENKWGEKEVENLNCIIEVDFKIELKTQDKRHHVNGRIIRQPTLLSYLENRRENRWVAHCSKALVSHQRDLIGENLLLSVHEFTLQTWMLKKKRVLSPACK